jgi:hypothetical protein
MRFYPSLRGPGTPGELLCFLGTSPPCAKLQVNYPLPCIRRGHLCLLLLVAGLLGLGCLIKYFITYVFNHLKIEVCKYIISARIDSDILFPLNHENTPANGALAPGPCKPLPRRTTGIWKMRTSGIAAGKGTGGGPAGELGRYQMRRGIRRKADRRPLGNGGRMGTLVFLSVRFLPHRDFIERPNRGF